MSTKSQLDFICEVKKNLDKNDEILYLGEIDNEFAFHKKVSEKTFLCIYMPSTSSMLLGNQKFKKNLHKEIRPNTFVEFEALQITMARSIIKSNLNSLFNSISYKRDYLMKNEVIDFIYKHKNLMIDDYNLQFLKLPETDKISNSMYHEGFVESVILGMYSGEDFNELYEDVQTYTE